MKRDNKYLLKTLDLLDKLQQVFDIDYDRDNKYYSIIADMKKRFSTKECIENLNTFKLDNSIREEIQKLLYSMNIKNFPKKIGNFYMIMTTGYAIEDETKVPKMQLEQLADVYLCRFFVYFLSTISFSQKDNLLLVKYNKSIWNFGYNNLTNICRGKVIDINTKQIVSYPFDKFFNLGECEETSIDKMQDIIDNAKYISVMDKVDGSTIIITKTENDFIVNTNGGFNNIQTQLAKKLLVDKYKNSLDQMEIGYTYIFELIHPQDSKVVDYKGAKKLVLLSVRDLTDKRLLRYEECVEVAKNLNMDVVECFEFTNLNEFVTMAKTVKNSNREGWVIRVITNEEDILFKLKIDEYCILHKSILGKVNPFNVYELMVNDILDDTLSKSDEGTKVLILDMVDKINNVLENIEINLRNLLDEVKSKFDITQEEFQQAKTDRTHPKYMLRVELIKYLQQHHKGYLDYDGVMDYYGKGISVEDFIKNLTVSKFKSLCKNKKLLTEEEVKLNN